MKRKLFISLALSLFAVGVVETTQVAQNIITLKDIRVMAKAQTQFVHIAQYDDDGGGGQGNTVDCYSEGEKKVGHYHVFCGTCERITGSKGTGRKRTCAYKN